MKIVLILLSVICFIGPKINSQDSFDTKYTVEYALKDAAGNIKSKMKLYRSGNKLKFQKFDNAGKPDSSRTDIYILKDEPKIYSIVTNSAGKLGTKNDVDIMYIGIQTGVYILDLGHDGKIFNSSTRNGSNTVLSMECIKYTIASNAEASSDYYMYQDNLMLKKMGWLCN